MKETFSVITIISLVLSLSTPAFATTSTWNSSGSGTWNTSGNWSPSGVPNGNGNTAQLTSSISSPTTVDLGNTNETVGTLQIGTSGESWTLESSNGGVLNINNLGSVNLASINQETGSTNTISAPITASDPQDVLLLDNYSSTAFTISGGISSGSGNQQIQTDGGGTGTLVLSGNITNGSGTISIVQSSINAMTLSGTNSYTGGMYLQEGTLNINSTTALGATASVFYLEGAGNVTINNTSGSAITNANNNAVNIYASFSFGSSGGAASNDLNLGTGAVYYSGNNTITLNGEDMLTFGGVMTNAGDQMLTVNNGSGTNATTALNIGGYALSNSATNYVDVINGSGNVNITGTVGNGASSASGLTYSGTGTLTLSGTNTYTGGTTISSGTLAVGNASALGTGAVTNNATLNIGTTNLTGITTYAQSSGASLGFTTNSATNYGSITSSGAATLSSGSLVNVAFGNNYYIPTGTVLTIINGGSGSSYTLPSSDISSSDSRVSFTSSTSGNDLLLTAERAATGFASLASSPNSKAAGNVLDNITNPTSNMTTILNTLEGSSSSQITSVLNTVIPIIDAGVRDDSAASLNNFVGASIDRAQNVLNLASAGNFGTTGVSAGDEGQLNGLWAKQYGSYLNQGTDQGISGYNAWNTGTAVGFDHLFDETLTLGISGGYSYGRVNSADNYGNTDINSAQCTLYAGYQDASHPYFIDAAGTSAWNWYDGQRYISPSILNFDGSSNYRGEQYGAYLDGGYNIDLGHNIQLTPISSFQWDHLAVGHYTETGAGALDLRVNRQSYDMLESGLGARITTTQIAYAWGDLFPELHAKWLHDFTSDGMDISSEFTGGGGAFTTNGIKPPMNGVDLGGKLTFDLKNNISIIAGFDTEIKDHFYGVSGTIEVRYKF